MRTPRQHFPYTHGTGIFVHSATLNLLAQVKATGESWTMCVERIVRQWSKDRGLTLHDSPTVIESLQTRQAIDSLPLSDEEDRNNGRTS